jgi:hypothetical protein
MFDDTVWEIKKDLVLGLRVSLEKVEVPHYCFPSK